MLTINASSIVNLIKFSVEEAFIVNYISQTGSVYTLVGVAVREQEDMVSYTCAVGLGRKVSKRKIARDDVAHSDDN